MTRPRVVNYVTSSRAKKEELGVVTAKGTLSTGEAVKTEFIFAVFDNRVVETLEQDIAAMVSAEARAAYAQVKVPCIVEHAGLVFEGYSHYPGGLTKPMWNTLGSSFLTETQSAGRRATARAVIGYCDGMGVRTFIGETSGTLASSPRGRRDFYWDTIFVPDDPSGKASGKTYAEIVDDPALGLDYKVLELSQSWKALRSFLELIHRAPLAPLWMIT